MIQTWTDQYSSMYYPRWDEQGIHQQILNKKSISGKITHSQSLFKKIQGLRMSILREINFLLKIC